MGANWILITVLSIGQASASGATESAPERKSHDQETVAENVPGDAVEYEARTYKAIADDMRAAFHAEAKAKTRDERWVAAVQMTALFDEITSHPNYESSDTLFSYRNRLWSKLKRSKSAIERELEKIREEDARAQKLAEKPDGRAPIANGSPAKDSSGDRRTAAIGSSSPSLSVLDGRSLADSGQSDRDDGDGAQGGGFGPADEGAALVELIERTIAPDHWDVNGGPGVIVYYAPLKALVIRANAQVHGRVGGLLGAARANVP